MSGRVRLRRVAQGEAAAWLEASRRRYAAELEEAGGLDPVLAAEKAERDIATALPEGIATPGAHLYVVEESASGEPVGRLWFSLLEHDGTPAAWLYEIVLDPPVRGRGLGREAMELFEAEARTLGARRVALNVFGSNPVARSLYRRLGYAERTVLMDREL